MSTDYILRKKIRGARLVDGELEEFGVREVIVPGQSSVNAMCLTDGANAAWVWIEDNGVVDSLTRFGDNDPDNILEAIALMFETDIFSEHEPEFWGCANWDEYQSGGAPIGATTALEIES
jgi:hypothetical protein